MQIVLYLYVHADSVVFVCSVHVDSAVFACSVQILLLFADFSVHLLVSQSVPSIFAQANIIQQHSTTTLNNNI